MLETKVDTQMNPRILTDIELLEFAHRHVDSTGGMPISFQQELLARFEKRLKNN